MQMDVYLCTSGSAQHNQRANRLMEQSVCSAGCVFASGRLKSHQVTHRPQSAVPLQTYQQTASSYTHGGVSSPVQPVLILPLDRQSGGATWPTGFFAP
ncbi:hypothetical protein PGTUg99_036553 [Puccinia graminis f. sp. tritici]|uniref:Uncharacterized protein n=1 Tax=Puccinia graminis f. sp. tritici TaxID=56615 RepID=A0A5B0RQC1_PUCGR|nr:hypothetical protein PGTUg99_036553 [Puccinia graminis f. sp. tritici]